jgi:protein gp37
MATNSKIEWTDDTWTPIRARAIDIQNDGAGKERIGWHCEHASPGCKNCYSEGINRRLGTRRDFKPTHLIHKLANGDQRGDVSVYLDEKMLLAPLHRKSSRMVFPCSMTDLFGRFVRDEWIDKVFAVIALTPRHRYQVLTKRADRMAAYLSDPDARNRIIGRAWEMLGHLPKYKHEGILQRPWPLPNVWAGASVEDEERAGERRAPLTSLAAAGWITWASYEPALGPVDWTGWEFLHWMVSGGESGQKARPSHPDWHRCARDFAAKHGIAYLFKQWGEWAPPTKLEDLRFLGDMMRAGKAVHVYGEGREHDGHFRKGDDHLLRIGKKAAGRLLDGVTHNSFPETPR